LKALPAYTCKIQWWPLGKFSLVFFLVRYAEGQIRTHHKPIMSLSIVGLGTFIKDLFRE